MPNLHHGKVIRTLLVEVRIKHSVSCKHTLPPNALIYWDDVHNHVYNVYILCTVYIMYTVYVYNVNHLTDSLSYKLEL